MNQKIIADRLNLAGDDFLRLEHYGFKVFSQSDEDGIIEEIFRRIGFTNRRFVDFGAETGNENNSRYLLEQGWSGLWIEAVSDYAIAIRSEQKDRLESGQLKFASTGVTVENINGLITAAGLSGEIDFLSIDIDGNDYHILEAIHVVQPRVICLEHNATYPPPEDYVMPYDAAYKWDAASTSYGASIVAFERLAKSKGYVLVGCGLYSPNGFYVRADLAAEGLFSEPRSSARFFNPFSYPDILGFPRDEGRFSAFQNQRQPASQSQEITRLTAAFETQRTQAAQFREKYREIAEKAAAYREKIVHLKNKVGSQREEISSLRKAQHVTSKIGKLFRRFK